MISSVMTPEPVCHDISGDEVENDIVVHDRLCNKVSSLDVFKVLSTKQGNESGMGKKIEL